MKWRGENKKGQTAGERGGKTKREASCEGSSKITGVMKSLRREKREQIDSGLRVKESTPPRIKKEQMSLPTVQIVGADRTQPNAPPWFLSIKVRRTPKEGSQGSAGGQGPSASG